MYNLGTAYIKGMGLVRDTDKGVSWFKQAANADITRAFHSSESTMSFPNVLIFNRSY